MSQPAPGRFYRQGLSLPAMFRMFPDDAAAERWFVAQRWPDGIIVCHRCGSERVLTGAQHKTMPYRCRDCRKRFSVRTGTVMEDSKLGFQVWAMAIYMLTTSLKGVSSMKLYRELAITQKSAWFLGHRLRHTWADDGRPFTGPVEADETFVGGKEKNKHAHKKLHGGRGPVGKTAIVGIKDRATKRVRAAVVENTDADTLKGFVTESTAPGAMVYTDGESGYVGLPKHEAVKHSIGEYVRDKAHTNGIESFWSLLKRGYVGTYHKMSPKHLDRYVGEFAGRHNQRPADTLDQMSAMVRGMDQKRLRYNDLVV